MFLGKTNKEITFKHGDITAGAIYLFSGDGAIDVCLQGNRVHRFRGNNLILLTGDTDIYT